MVFIDRNKIEMVERMLLKYNLTLFFIDLLFNPSPQPLLNDNVMEGASFISEKRLIADV